MQVLNGSGVVGQAAEAAEALRAAGFQVPFTGNS
ncbi:LytR C-terminal domain-containing protein, partial [Streptomyces calidiresistens]